MEKPEIKHELEVSHGSIYGLEEAQALMEVLKNRAPSCGKKGIKAWSHYMLIHLIDPYRAQGHTEGECPVAEQVFHKYVTLPIHPRLSDEAIDYMADSIGELAKH